MGLFGGNRSISVKLSIDPKGALAGIATARKATGDFARDLEKAATKHKRAFDSLGGTFTKVGLGLTAFAGVAVVSAAQFDKAMSRAKAATQATTGELTALRQAAIIAGRDTQYSATEAADGITEMAKAGVSTKDILGGGLRASLNLAAAGELSVADAANISATALTQFNLKGKDLGHVADLLAAGAGKAQGSVTDLSEALKYVGPVANSLGVSIDQTVGSLAELASKGIIGEQAGTSLRGVLLSLTAPSKAARTEMQALGISVFDAQGKFIGVDGAAKALHDSLSGMSQAQRTAALGTIFGNEQITAAQVLYAGGAKAVQDWTGKVADAGFASRQAATLMDNLSGDVEQLKGSLETAFISGGSGATGGLRDLVQVVTEAVNVFTALPPIVQQSTVVLAGLAGGGLLVAGGLLKGVGAVADFKKNLNELSVAADGSKTKFGGLVGALGGPWGLAITGGTLALTYFLKQAADAKQRVQELTDALHEDSGAIGENTRAATARTLQQSGAIADARALGLSIADVTQAALGNNDAWTRVNAVLNEYQPIATGAGTVMTDQARAADNLRGVIGQQAGDLKEATQAQKDIQEATDAATPASERAAGALTKVGVVAKTAAQQMDELVSTVDALYGRFLSVQEASDAFQTSLHRIADAAKGANRDLHGNSDATLSARDAMRGAVKQGLDYVDALIRQHAPQKQVAAAARASAAAIDAAGKKAGLSKKATQEYSDVLRRVPKVVSTNVQANTAQAVAKLSDIVTTIARINDKTVTIRVNKSDGTAALTSSAGGHTATRVARASGGIIPGPPSNADNRVALVATGEFVVNTRQTTKHRALLEAINSGVQGFADGGVVPAVPFGLSDVRSRYDATLPKPITAAQVTAAQNRARNAALAVDKAERDLATTRRKHPHDVNAIRDAEDRLDKARRAQTVARTAEATAVARSRAPRGFNLGNYLTQLEGTARGTRNYRRDLAAVGKRGGSQLAALLEAEGGGSADLVHALARATPAQLARALKSLRSLNPAAFASAASSSGRVFNFASGGTYGVNSAQVAPDGAYRVWAEKGTGGEAYIPLGAGNRARSRMVAAEVVARLGGSVAWSTARPSGAGQVSALPSAAGGMADRSGPLMQVGTITQTSGSPHEIAADLMFNLRTMGY